MQQLFLCSKWVLFAICFYVNSVIAIDDLENKETFVVSFQEDGTWSTNQWMRHNAKITGIGKEFTVCHWEKLRYFSTAINSVWAYCYVKNNAVKMKCWQVYHETNLQSAGRKVNLIGTSFPWSITVDALPYKHRHWNHFCLTYSSIKEISKVYHNGKLMRSELEANFTDIENGESVWRSSFIIGQEPDIFEGGYDPAQLFNGEISELNMWSKVLNDEEIGSLSNCSIVIQGDVISWYEENFTINQAKVSRLQNSSLFCDQTKQLVIFPQKKSFKSAKALCNIHGGNLAVPESENEEDEIMKVVSKHKKACLVPSNNLQKGKAVWLGMERMNGIWYSSNATNTFEQITYSNWDATRCTSKDCGSPDLGCPYIQTDGFWAFGLSIGTCSSLELCTVCSFTETPIFTLKGTCSEDSQLDWNYYFLANDTNQIVKYEGYKTSNLTEEDGLWTIQDIGVSAETSSDYPIGRRQWNYIDRTCGMKSRIQTHLAISRCSFGKEYTCNSGECISMSKRCNKRSDCNDESDEESCQLVRIPNSYEKIDYPVLHEEGNEVVYLVTQFNVLTVDIIDTLKMLIGITFEIRIYWNDNRLSYENLDAKGNNLISEEVANKLWLPSDNIIHDNAILGEILKDNHRDVGVNNLTAPEPMTIVNSMENYIYKGSKTRLFMVQRFKTISSCIFELSKFPFDEHGCNLTLKLKLGSANLISFANDKPSVIYNGPNTVGQFRIANMSSTILNDLNSTKFIFSIRIYRLYMNQMLNSFLPTVLLWSVAYFTHFIDIENFSDRFIGTVTALLVLVALLSSVNGDLPKTSYFKFIDCWFLYYITTILFIILFHIFLNRVKSNQIGANSVRMFKEDKEAEVPCMRTRINKFSIVCFAVLTILFDAVYFYLTAL